MSGHDVQVALASAATDLAAAEAAETCSYCQGHIRQVRVAVDDLAALASLMDHTERHPAFAAVTRRVAESAEATGALALLARIFRRLRGGR